MTERNVQAECEWTPWTRLDEAAPLLAIGTDQTYDELAGTLAHLQELGQMQFGHDTDGHLWYRTRMDHAARALALLDDHACTSRN
jgi:hypothetical protein